MMDIRSVPIQRRRGLQRDPCRMSGREDRKARKAAQADELVELALSFKRMTPQERVAKAKRADLTDNEQLALATFADDPDVADALLTNSDLSSAAEGVAEAMRDEAERKQRPWWRRGFG